MYIASDSANRKCLISFLLLLCDCYVLFVFILQKELNFLETWTPKWKELGKGLTGSLWEIQDSGEPQPLRTITEFAQEAWHWRRGNIGAFYRVYMDMGSGFYKQKCCAGPWGVGGVDCDVEKEGERFFCILRSSSIAISFLGGSQRQNPVSQYGWKMY